MATTQSGGTKTAAKTSGAKTTGTATKSKTGKMENSEFHEFFIDELKELSLREALAVCTPPAPKPSARTPVS